VIDVIQFIVLGAATGGILSMLALGVNVINRASRVINFSHAAIAIACAYIYRDAVSVLPVPLAMLVAIVAGLLLGLLTELLIMRPMRHASPLTRAIATIGLLITIQAALTLRYGVGAVRVQPWLPTESIEIGGVALGMDRLIVLGISAAASAALYYVYRRTSFGIASTALASSERSLAALGRWRPSVVAAANWMLAGGLAAFAGVLFAPMTILNPTLSTILVVPILSCALLGRLESFGLTFLGALGIGIAQSLLSRFELFQGATETLPFVVIAIVLALRGSGLPRRGDEADRLPVIGSGRIPWPAIGIAVVVAVLLVTLVLPQEWVAAVSVGLASAAVLLSLVVVTGYAGQLSLASFALAGVAALVSGQLVANAGWAFVPAALVGVAATIPVGFLVGLPAVRTRGTSLAIVTLGFAVALQAAVFNNPDISGGFSGLAVGEIDLFGLPVSGVFQPRSYAVMVIVVFTAMGLLVLNLRRSAAGRRMVAVRGNERAAASLGIGVAATKLHAFVVSALFAGVGGILVAFSNFAVVLGNPGGRFDPSVSLNAIAQATVGGIGYVSGAILGTISEPGGVVAKLLSVIASGSWFTLIGGLLLLVTVVTAPSGIIPNMRGLFGGRRKSQSEAARVPGAAERQEEFEPPTVTPVPPAVLRARGLTVTFGGNRALDGVDLDLEPGTVLGIIGPNGAGKTTLVDALTGYTRLTSGSIELDGDDIGALAPHQRSRRGIGRSFQSLELFEDLSVRDNLLVAADDRSWSRTALAGIAPGKPSLSPAARAAVDRFGLAPHLDASPAGLSFGERRLLAIARALSGSPRILMLDEPAAGLGSEERNELRRLVRHLADDWGIAVLIIEHDVDLVLGVSDRVLALDFGRTIAVGTPAQVRADDAVVAAYLGSEEEAIA
jgi:sulfate-transporting ATPase